MVPKVSYFTGFSAITSICVLVSIFVMLVIKLTECFNDSKIMIWGLILVNIAIIVYITVTNYPPPGDGYDLSASDHILGIIQVI